MSDALLAAAERLELRPAAVAGALGRTVVVAPHPDDESLACGGLLALLARQGAEAHVVVMTDGAASHPGSAAFPPDRLAGLREVEAREALRRLGHGERIAFLGLPDGNVPAPGTEAFARAVVALRETLEALAPETVVLPWRHDPHPDHQAVWRIADAALAPMASPVRRLEVPIWAWHRGDAPALDPASAWRLDVASVLVDKAAAVAAHASQTTGLVRDSPDGFTLTPDLLVPFERGWEVYIDVPATGSDIASALPTPPLAPR